jgi:hypothetical protein
VVQTEIQNSVEVVVAEGAHHQLLGQGQPVALEVPVEVEVEVVGRQLRQVPH